MSKLVNYCYIIAGAKIAGKGTPQELASSKDEGIDQFINGKVEGPIPFHYQSPGLAWSLLN
jgi:phospholipid/cholesterol/gamma-HCH transport system ATP-binding protein